jgi:tetratricopeptide (TPR) repeat protein
MRKDKLLAAALKQQQRGNLAKAQPLLRQAAALDPKDGRTWMILAEVCNRLQDNAGAILAYEKAAHLLREQGFVRRAIAVYKNILAIAPEKIQTRIDAATASAEVGLIADAVSQYETVVSALLLQGKAELAVAVLLQWRAIDKNNLVLQLKLAEVSLQAGLEEEGQSLLAQSAERFLEERNFDEYVRVAERLLTRDPQNVALRKSLARVYLASDRSEHALARLAPCCATSTDDTEVLSMLAQGFEGRGQIEKAVTVLRALGEVFHDQGALEESLITYQKILSLRPSDEAARGRVNALGVGFLPQSWRTPTNELVDEVPAVFDQNDSGEVTTTYRVNAQIEKLHPPFDLTARPRSFSNDDPTALMRVDLLNQQLSRCDDDFPSPKNLPPLCVPPPCTDVDQLLGDCNVLMELMVERLTRVLAVAPCHVGAREKLAYVLLQLGRAPAAVEHLTWLSEHGRVAEPSWSPRLTDPAALMPAR